MKSKDVSALDYQSMVKMVSVIILNDDDFARNYQAYQECLNRVEEMREGAMLYTVLAKLALKERKRYLMEAVTQ